MNFDGSRRGILMASLVGAGALAHASGASSPEAGRLRILEDMDALRVATDLSLGDIALLLGRREALDGGGALWRVVSDGPADDACCVVLAGGLFARLSRESRHDVREAGVFSDTDGETTASALVSLTQHMIAGGGGVMEFAQPIQSGNVIFPPIPQDAPISFEMVGGGQVTPSNPTPGTFMWDFPADDAVIYPSFRNVLLTGPKTGRLMCNGIRIGASNRMTIDNCFGRFIGGCAWQIEGPNNARIDITTYECGTEDGVYAQNYLAHRGPDKTPNDIVLQGTTERDRFGINVEGGAILRDGSAIKLHGFVHTRRALRLHRCTAFDLKVFASQQWAGDGFILISDSGGADKSLVVEPEWLSTNLRGTLTIATMHNIRYSGRGTGHWCVVDLQSPSSFLKIAGFIVPQADPVHPGSAFHQIRVVGPGNQGVTLDMEDLRFPGATEPERQIRDERSDTMRARNRPQTAMSRRAARRLTPADIVDGEVDLRGVDYGEIVADKPTILRRIGLEIDQQCTICAPTGNLRIKNTTHILLTGAADFVMGPGATLTLRRVDRNRFQEIARCER